MHSLAHPPMIDTLSSSLKCKKIATRQNISVCEDNIIDNQCTIWSSFTSPSCKGINNHYSYY